MTAGNDEGSASGLKPWTVRASAWALRDRWLNVRADDCITADGVEIAPFYVLDYPDWIQVVAIDADDHLVLVEQYRHGLGRLSLELPCGGMEPEDANPLQAAARELLEETGYVASEMRHIAALSPNAANHANRAHVVLALGAEARQPPQDNSRERLRIFRTPVSEVARICMTGQIVQAIHVASLALALSGIGRWTP